MDAHLADGGARGVLPSSPGPLIGRAAEVARACELLQRGDARLLTLCGVGGIGKTRLALEVARTVRADFADGVCWVELATVREPGLVLPAIAAVIQPGLPPGRRSALDAVQRLLRPLHLLLVLDNFEHVLDAASLVAELLAACPRLSVLVTSRSPLRLRWEREVAVGPLGVPPADDDDRADDLLACPSVALLVDRMAGLGLEPGRDPTALAALAAICRRLDGIPLAIELAAARAKVLAPSALLDRLAHPLDLLSDGPRDAPARHRALRTTFDWSYALLGEAERRLFRHLGVFVGGCTVEAAAGVCGLDAANVRFLDALGRLLDSGLVTRVDAAAPEPRLLLLEPVREYALEQLRACGEDAAARERHAATYLDLAERVDAELRGPHERDWLPRLDGDHGNSLVALRWLINQGDVERSLRLASALCMYWWVRGFTREGLERVQQALALAAPERSDRALATARAVAMSLAGALLYWQGDVEAATSYERAALQAFPDGSPPHRRAFAVITLGTCAVAHGDLQGAEAHYLESRELFRLAGDQRGLAHTVLNVGQVAFFRGEHERARALLEEGIPAVAAAGDLRTAAYGLRTLAMLQCQRGDFGAAQACVRDGLAMWREVHGRVLLPFLLEAAAIVAVGLGDHARALRVAGGAAALREHLDTPCPPATLRELTPWLDRARAALGEQASASAWSDGLALDADGAVAAALAPGARAGEPDRTSSPAPLAALPGRLTRREAEVLRLVAGGSTNKEIATLLSVSVATVERHLANTYAKLGARGRAEATAFALTRGLVAASPD